MYPAPGSRDDARAPGAVGRVRVRHAKADRDGQEHHGGGHDAGETLQERRFPYRGRFTTDSLTLLREG